jgi:hypothetical protein
VSSASRRARGTGHDQEIVAIGTANVAAGLFSGFPVSTSSSRTAVADQAGARSQLAGLAAAGLVLAMLLVAPGLVAALPIPVLAAVIILAGSRLLDVPGLARLWQVRRCDFGIAAACFLGVALVGVLEGISSRWPSGGCHLHSAWRPTQRCSARRASWPATTMSRVTPIPNGSAWSSCAGTTLASPTRRLRDRVANRGLDQPPPRWVLIAAEPITDIATAADMLVSSMRS